MTGFNTFLLSAASALVGFGVASIKEDLVVGTIQLALGIICFLVYEKTPSSN